LVEPSRVLSHPLWLAALVVLVVNDHLLKGAGWIDPAVTSKLSDLAGLVVAPIVLAALLRVRRCSGLLACHLAVGAVFCAINLVPALGRLWTDLFASFGIPWRVWSDPSDLLTLPALGLSFLVFHAPRRRPHAPPRMLQRLALALGALACIASSPWPVAKPAVVGDRVLVEHQLGVMFVVDASTGSVARTLRASGANRAPPAIHDHILYQVQRDGRITGIHIDNPQSPFDLWTGPSGIWLRIIAVDDHRLYVAADNDRLYAIDRVFGRTAWSVSVETQHLEQVALVGDTVIASVQERVLAWNARTGAARWTYEAQDAAGPAVVRDRIAYVLSADGVIHGLAVPLGEEVWRYDGRRDACSSFAPRVFVGPSAVYACIGDGVVAVDRKSRKARWSRERVPVALGNGVLVVRDGSDTLAGVDTDNGQRIWTRELDDAMWTHPVIGEGAAYVRNDVGKLYAVELRSGVLRWTLDMDRDGRAVAVGKGGAQLVD